MRRGLFIGRFQPFHKGHLYVVKIALKEVDELIIGIGSTQLNYEVSNPFTCGERLQMIREALREENISPDKYWLIPIPDIHNNYVWVSHVESLCPPFHVVYGGNKHTLKLFKDAGYEVKEVEIYGSGEYSGTEIRKKMLNKEPWETYVPLAVANFIKKIKGVERLLTIAESK